MNRLRGFLLALVVTASSASAPAADVPFLAGRVNDTAGMLSLDAAGKLDAMLRAHEDSTSNQVVVLTVSSLEGEEIEAFAIRVVDTWKLGQKGKDNGVLFVVARDERKVRIEVGRGLEGNLPDITCGTIIRKEVLPKFKAGDMDGGTIAGVEAILAAIRGAYTPEEETDAVEGFLAGLVGFMIFLSVVGIFTIMGIIGQGFIGWFLYLFLMPFWFLFPTAMLGDVPGKAVFGAFLIGYPVFKLWLKLSPGGKSLQKRLGASGFGGSGGGWSSGSSGSSGGGFSGGGGSFSGGGASGSW
jgi:uncharacterized protein